VLNDISGSQWLFDWSPQLRSLHLTPGRNKTKSQVHWCHICSARSKSEWKYQYISLVVNKMMGEKGCNYFDTELEVRTSYGPHHDKLNRCIRQHRECKPFSVESLTWHHKPQWPVYCIVTASELLCGTAAWQLSSSYNHSLDHQTQTQQQMIALWCWHNTSVCYAELQCILSLTVHLWVSERVRVLKPGELK